MGQMSARGAFRPAQVVAGAAVWLLAVAASPVHAQSQAPSQTYFGMAGLTCAQFTKAARASDMVFHQASQWLLGYVSGMNVAMKSAQGTTPVSNLSNDQVLRSAGDFCARNPGSNLANAANEWYATLPKQTDPAVAEAKPAEKKSGLWLNLDTAPKIKPLLDRR